jgi:hypothetical protein
MPVTRLKKIFPRLRFSEHRHTSHRNKKYNCICWAANTAPRDIWWPDPDGYWPAGVRRDQTIEAFIEAFAALGYAPCPDSTLEDGYEKVALFALPGGVPTHMARQLPSGSWTSKLGRLEDIEHKDVEALNGDAYGAPVRFLKRSTRQAPNELLRSSVA